ncbi:hypothetical protein D7Z54_33925 [Salibacterium salarium]|uniref:Uncharacterized protein n=1 Tax=Salibacterium salarium TaxID=284579 RepID=A0A3R9QF05_9BACI|nr:hypothetical protein D7Z54_33925 [Salibacterium salarium]
MNFFKMYEKSLVKSLVYGFVIGLFYSLLFVPTFDLIPNGTTQIVQSNTPFEYTIKILQISVVIAICSLMINSLYQYYKFKRNN